MLAAGFVGCSNMSREWIIYERTAAKSGVVPHKLPQHWGEITEEAVLAVIPRG